MLSETASGTPSEPTPGIFQEFLKGSSTNSSWDSFRNTFCNFFTNFSWEFFRNYYSNLLTYLSRDFLRKFSRDFFRTPGIPSGIPFGVSSWDFFRNCSFYSSVLEYRRFVLDPVFCDFLLLWFPPGNPSEIHLRVRSEIPEIVLSTFAGIHSRISCGMPSGIPADFFFYFYKDF